MLRCPHTKCLFDQLVQDVIKMIQQIHTQGNFGWCPPGVLFYSQENKFITAASLRLLHVKFALFLDCKVGLDPCRGGKRRKSSISECKTVFCFLFI